MTLVELQNWVSDKKAEKALLEKQLENKQDLLISKKIYYDNLLKARLLLTEASRLTQTRMKEKVESLVTMVLQGVYGVQYKFLVDFEIKRNKSECLLRVQKGSGEPFIPKDEQGGGLLDVIGFALRVVLWSIERPRKRAFFMLDEPGKWTGNNINKFGEMIREVSEKLGIQILLVTHDENLILIANRNWKVRHNGVFCEVEG